MKIFSPYVSFQEVPDEISLCIPAYGCPVGCDGCHYSGRDYDHNWTYSRLLQLIQGTLGITCVCFLGGEWNTGLSHLIDSVKTDTDLKIALYTGLRDICIPGIDYLKTGPYIMELGGLSERTTNQRMVDLNKKEDITYKFWK